MEMNPIGWIDLPATDLDRAEKFYGDFFGFEFKRQSEMGGRTMSWFPMDMKVYGSGITLMKADDCVPAGANGPLIYFAAPGDGLKDALSKAEGLGIKVVLDHTSIGEHGHYAVIEDSEGNNVAIHSMKE